MIACSRPADPATRAADADDAASASEPLLADALPPRAGDASEVTRLPAACADGGARAWFLVESGATCASSTTSLVWVEGGNVHRAGPDGSDEKVSELPSPYSGELAANIRSATDFDRDCFGGQMGVTEARNLGTDARGWSKYRLVLDGVDFGGMGCHAIFARHLTGEVVVDELGLIVKGKLTGTETVTADAHCSDMPSTRPWTFEVRRSCSPP